MFAAFFLLAFCMLLTEAIYRGDVAHSGQFPYIVSMRQVIKPGRSSYRHFCGGTIISDRFVLTAAHCCINISSVDDIRIFMGTIENDPRDTDNMLKVKKIIIHEDFDEKKMRNDIALFWTKIRVKFSDKIQPILLSKKWIQPDEDGVFTGFGIIGMLMNKK